MPSLEGWTHAPQRAAVLRDAAQGARLLRMTGERVARPKLGLAPQSRSPHEQSEMRVRPPRLSLRSCGLRLAENLIQRGAICCVNQLRMRFAQCFHHHAG